MTTEAAATITTESTTAAGTEQTWWAGLDEETRGYVQNKGLSTKPINEAFAQVSKFHREAEKMIGAPANELLRLPKDPASPDWANVYKRLGALAAPDDYKFDGIKQSGDKPLNEGLAATLRKAAHGAHLSNDAANAVAKEIVTHLDSVESSKRAQDQATLDAETKALKDNWGTNYVANKVVASAAANALGVSAEELEALGKIKGFAKTMELFRNIGTKIGEDRFVKSDGNGGDKVMTKEGAVAEREALKRDAAWVGRYNNGGLEERRKMEALNHIISGS